MIFLIFFKKRSCLINYGGEISYQRINQQKVEIKKFKKKQQFNLFKENFKNLGINIDNEILNWPIFSNKRTYKKKTQKEVEINKKPDKVVLY